MALGSKNYPMELGLSKAMNAFPQDIEIFRKPAPTLASATTVAPSRPVTFVSGVAAIVNITVPKRVKKAGGGRISFVPTGIFTWTAAGNIAVAGTAVVGKTLDLVYDKATAKWYPSYLA